MFNKIKSKITKFCDRVFPEINFIVEKIEDNQRILARMETILEDEKNKIEYELCFYKGFAEILIEESPDMVWLKDTDGKYMIANTAIKKQLLFTDCPYGRNDIDISNKAKKQFGEENHTFGEVCGNSDLVVLNNLKAQRFLESGKVKGEMMYLEVFKFPFFVDGKLIGIGGIGRNMTPYVKAYRGDDCNNCKNGNKTKDVFSQFEFKG